MLSTVFLGIDHSFGGGEPVLFETMIFEVKNGTVGNATGNKDEGEFQVRYCTEEEALWGHDILINIMEGQQRFPTSNDLEDLVKPTYGDDVI